MAFLYNVHMGRGGKGHNRGGALKPASERFLGCPSCRSVESLQTIEKLEALSNVSRITFDGEIDFAGDTEVLWDSSTTVGVFCQNCNWEYEGERWIDKLVPSDQ